VGSKVKIQLSDENFGDRRGDKGAQLTNGWSRKEKLSRGKPAVLLCLHYFRLLNFFLVKFRNHI
jgi:hypothetical protein